MEWPEPVWPLGAEDGAHPGQEPCIAGPLTHTHSHSDGPMWTRLLI